MKTSVFTLVNMGLRPSSVKSNKAYVLKFVKPLNYRHDQKFAEKKKVAHNLLHAFCHMIDRLNVIRK